MDFRTGRVPKRRGSADVSKPEVTGMPVLQLHGSTSAAPPNDLRPFALSSFGRSSPSMTHDATVARRQLEIRNALGLHMRPADKFVRLAIRYLSDVKVYHHGGEFNGKSILDLTGLGAECGTVLEVEARGPDAEKAVEALEALVLARFYEDDDGQELVQEKAQDPAP
jgi:phosphocarrier protein HPr